MRNQPETMSLRKRLKRTTIAMVHPGTAMVEGKAEPIRLGPSTTADTVSRFQNDNACTAFDQATSRRYTGSPRANDNDIGLSRYARPNRCCAKQAQATKYCPAMEHCHVSVPVTEVR